MSRHLPGTGKARPGGEGAQGPPRLTASLGFQVPHLDAGPPAHPPRTSAARCPQHGQWPFPGCALEPRPLGCSDGGPWAPAPCPEPPALTGWPVARGESLRGHGPGPGSSRSDVPPPAPGVCEMGKDPDPAGGRRSLGPGPGGARPAAPGGREPLAPDSLRGGPPSSWHQRKPPSENLLCVTPPPLNHLPPHPIPC